jgi:hypothetical protein
MNVVVFGADCLVGEAHEAFQAVEREMFDDRLLVGKLAPEHVREHALDKGGLLGRIELIKLGENSLGRGFTIDGKSSPDVEAVCRRIAHGVEARQSKLL